MKWHKPAQRTKFKLSWQRVDLVRWGFMLLAGIIILRLADLQLLDHGYYVALASDSRKIYEEIYPRRGEIYVQDKYSLNQQYMIVVNKTLAEVHAEPVHVKDAPALAQALSPLLQEPVEELLAHLNKTNDPNETLKKRVPTEVVDAIKSVALPDVQSAIKFSYEDWRYYPDSAYTAHLTGYFGYADNERVGQYGLESYYNTVLHGKNGQLNAERGGLGQVLTLGDAAITPAISGNDLVLTIDKNLQFFACEKLQASAEKFAAKGGTVIVLNPATGAILAMCNYPSFDPNNYNQVTDIDVFINAAVGKPYEAGSVFKTFTLAAGIDRGLIMPNSTYQDAGQVKVNGWPKPIRNSDGKAYGTQTMTQVLEKSLNTGSIHVAQLLGNETLYQYINNFGFGELTGIDLAGEQAGDISQLAELRDIYSANASFGQGITVTPIQLISAYAALANQGLLMKPYVVQKQITSEKTEIITQPTAVRQVVSANTARLIGAMLISVVNKEHKNAQMAGYLMGGKTGTAQIATNSGYDQYRHNDTFLGFPVNNPQFILLTKLSEPSTEWAEGSVVPLWKDIAQYLVNYYQLPPDETSN
ncbi:MAG: penicillin-binding protein 2 [Patescibacteria group bacterium]|jgi:cell division protein FtsI/penicillin-binding protein 2